MESSTGRGQREVRAVFTFKNISAVAFFLFGTTFVWMTASFAGKTPVPSGALWTVVNVLALLAVAAFTVTAWGVFKQTSWWEMTAVASAALGLIVVVPYVAAINDEGQLSDGGVALNIVLHLVCSLIVLAVAVVPVIHDWFAHRWALSA
jgi:hypothetical protein